MQYQCAGWAALGECRKNPTFMNAKCPKSCGVCSGYVLGVTSPLATVLLNNGVPMPVVGFGSAGLGRGQQVADAVAAALKAGYSHIDTAQAPEWWVGTARAT